MGMKHRLKSPNAGLDRFLPQTTSFFSVFSIARPGAEACRDDHFSSPLPLPGLVILLELGDLSKALSVGDNTT
jgi:hypothetical protein